MPSLIRMGEILFFFVLKMQMSFYLSIFYLIYMIFVKYPFQKLVMHVNRMI